MPLPATLHDPVILMADDSRDDCKLVEIALRRLNFRCSFNTVPDGLTLVATLHAKALPAMILLDLNMPIKSGFEALREIKSSPLWRSIPIIVWSTSHSMGDIRKTFDLGTNAFLTKPDSINGVVEAMRALTQFWFQNSKLPQALLINPN